jgi:MATE family multidrug resistance protein
MVVHLFGYWIIGLPIGAMLCFKTGWGAIGLWTGLCVGLILIGCILVFSWMRMIKQLASTNPSLGFVSAATETFLNR